MPRKLVGILLLLCLLLTNQSFLWAEEVSKPIETQQIQAVPQINDLRYSLGAEEDRLVFDFNAPFTYNVVNGLKGTEITISVDAMDNRIKKDYLCLKDKALKEVKISSDPSNPQKTLIQLYFHYEVPVEVWSLGNPERLVIDIDKVFEKQTVREVAPGIEYKHIYAATTEGPLQIDTLQVDLNNPNLEVKPALALKGQQFARETVSALASQVGALGAINGTYFAQNGRPLGLIMIDGKILTSPWAQRTALGITRDHRVLIDNVGLDYAIKTSYDKIIYADAWNCPREENQLVIYTSGSTTGTNQFGLEVSVVDNKVVDIGAGNMGIPSGGCVLSAHGTKKQLLEGLRIGDPVTVETTLVPNWSEEGVVQIISGGPRLVKNGQVFVTAQAEKFKADVTQGRAPRSALGVTKGQKLLLVAVTGRQPNRSIGLTLNELSKWMIKLGAIDAMNLDGGGSTAMVVEGKLVNSPSDGQERKVSNALVISKAKEMASEEQLGDKKPNWL